MKKLNLMLLLIAVVLTLTTVTQAQNATKPCTARFFVASDSARLHFAFTAPSCSGAAMEACNARAVEIKNDCEYRGEDGGTAYSSCRCQSIRYVKDCYEEAGCYYGSALFIEISPECFGIQ